MKIVVLLKEQIKFIVRWCSFTGLIGGVVKGTKFSKEQLSNLLQTIKQNPKAVEQFKKILKPVKEKVEPLVPRKITDTIEDDVFVEANTLVTDGKVRKVTTAIKNGLSNLRRKYLLQEDTIVQKCIKF